MYTVLGLYDSSICHSTDAEYKGFCNNINAYYCQKVKKKEVKKGTRSYNLSFPDWTLGNSLKASVGGVTGLRRRGLSDLLHLHMGWVYSGPRLFCLV